MANITAKSLSAPDAKTVVMDIPKTANPNIVLALLTFNVGGVIDSTEAKAHEVKGDFGTAGSRTIRRAVGRSCSTAGTAALRWRWT